MIQNPPVIPGEDRCQRNFCIHLPERCLDAYEGNLDLLEKVPTKIFSQMVGFSWWFILGRKSQRITWNNKSKVENCANKERRKRPSRENVGTCHRSASQERFGQRRFVLLTLIVQGSLNYQPNQCTISREIPKNYRKLCIVCFPQNG